MSEKTLSEAEKRLIKQVSEMTPSEKDRFSNYLDSQKESYTTQDLMELLGVSLWSIQRMLRKGFIKGARPCEVWMIPHAEFNMIKADPDIIRKRRKLAELEKLEGEKSHGRKT